MDFEYTAQDEKGDRITGQIKADSISILIGMLKNKGLLPLEVKKIATQKNGTQKSSSFFEPKIKLRDLVVFTRQLSSAINAGLLLSEALETIRHDLENRHLGKVIDEILNHIRGGSSFSSALTKYPKIFSGSFVAIVKTGEESGSLGRVLTDLANYLEETERLVRKIKSATHYPIFLISFSAIVVSLIVFFVIPKFKLIFSQFNFQLPLITRIVVGVSEMAIRNVIWFIPTLFISSIFLVSLLRFKKIRLFFDRSKLKIFIIGKIIKKIWIMRFSSTLSILLSAGVGLVTALPISSEVASNTYLKNIIEDIKNNIISGNSLSNSFKNEKIFPGMFVKMIQVGEKTGKLSEMFKRNASFYEKDLEDLMNAFTALIEPVLIVFIGSIVGVVVIAFYLPIFKVSQLIK